MLWNFKMVCKRMRAEATELSEHFLRMLNSIPRQHYQFLVALLKNLTILPHGQEEEAYFLLTLDF